MSESPDLPWWMYREDGGPTYLDRHGHQPGESCGPLCHGNPSPPGGNGGAEALADLLCPDLDTAK